MLLWVSNLCAGCFPNIWPHNIKFPLSLLICSISRSYYCQKLCFLKFAVWQLVWKMCHILIPPVAMALITRTNGVQNTGCKTDWKMFYVEYYLHFYCHINSFSIFDNKRSIKTNIWHCYTIQPRAVTSNHKKRVNGWLWNCIEAHFCTFLLQNKISNLVILLVIPTHKPVCRIRQFMRYHACRSIFPLFFSIVLLFISCAHKPYSADLHIKLLFLQVSGNLAFREFFVLQTLDYLPMHSLNCGFSSYFWYPL